MGSRVNLKLRSLKWSKHRLSLISATLFTAAILAFSYFSFGIWTTLIFTSGFLGGLILWIATPNRSVSFSAIKAPYFLTFAVFIFLHKVEENIFKFQFELSKITGTPVPEVTSPALILLLVLSVGGWLLVPILTKRGYRFGYYLAWTFFSAMGITELAHFIFPFLSKVRTDTFQECLACSSWHLLLGGACSGCHGFIAKTERVRHSYFRIGGNSGLYSSSDFSSSISLNLPLQPELRTSVEFHQTAQAIPQRTSHFRFAVCIQNLY